MKYLITSLSLSAFFALAPSVVGANETNDTVTAAVDGEFKAAAAKASAAVSSAGGDSSLGPLKPQVLVTGGVDSGEVAVTFATNTATWQNFGESTASVSFSAPYNKDDGRGSFITEAGLPNAYSVEIAGSISLVSTSFSETKKAYTDAKQSYLATKDAILQNCRAKFPDTPIKSCIDISDDELLKNHASKEQHRQIKLAKDGAEAALLKQSYLALQGSVNYGLEELKYRDPADFAKQDSTKDVFSLSASMLYIPKLSNHLAFVAGGEYEREYKLPDSETRCQPQQTGDNFLSCFNSAYGPPEKDDSATIFGAFRFSHGKGDRPITGEVKFAVDPDSGDWGVEAPLYLIKDKDQKYVGGIRVGYESEDKDAFFGVFVGSTFDFLKF